MLVPILAVLVSVLWHRIIKSHRDLNTVKFETILSETIRKRYERAILTWVGPLRLQLEALRFRIASGEREGCDGWGVALDLPGRSVALDGGIGVGTRPVAVSVLLPSWTTSRGREGGACES